MSDRNWGKGCIAALVLGNTAIGWSVINREINKTPTYYSAVDQRQSEPTLGSNYIETPAASGTPDRKEWREEQNLFAQRQMANWAHIMLWISAIGVALTGAGVLLIRDTLRSTESGIGIMRQTLAEAKSATAAAERTVDETRRIGEAQTRAYLAPVAAKVRFHAERFEVEVSLVNSGMTPAKMPEFSWSLALLRSDIVDASGNAQGGRTILMSARGLTTMFDVGSGHPVIEALKTEPVENVIQLRLGLESLDIEFFGSLRYTHVLFRDGEHESAFTIEYSLIDTSFIKLSSGEWFDLVPRSIAQNRSAIRAGRWLVSPMSPWQKSTL